MSRDVVVLGSTGSIGTQALEVIARSDGRFRVTGIGAGGSRADELIAQARTFRTEVVAVADAAAAATVREALDPSVKVLGGPQAMEELASWPCDVVLNGITGSIGLAPTLAALDAGRTLALANKESLIAGGPLVKERAAPGQVVPVDSEHSALWQCLAAGRSDQVRRLVLTASGGPFLGKSRAQLDDVTPAQALAHPTWDMGPVVTVNSATLVNKGLEVIEAHLLFDVPYADIAVVVHRQSLVHSMVEWVDGSTLAQASPPDMRLPIALALGWPERMPDVAPAFDWSVPSSWTFEPLDEAAFPAVGLARDAGERGGDAPAAFNAANEECVAAFLAGNLRFPEIVDTVAAVLAEHSVRIPTSPADVLDAETWARTAARTRIGAN
ncbi:MAG: 1-deoxy-D-xylulose-5-phosphate reductoisomerase [Frankiales bacterium]|nr:1-deoxy-D-xylulose-5-phosphate reductoisomerase [Frankiales bacterium]